MQIADNIQNLFLDRDNEYVRNVAAFVAKFLEANIFIERVYLDTLLFIVKKCDFTPDKVVRFRTLMDILSVDTMRDSIDLILDSSQEKMKIYVRKELEIWVKQMIPGD